MATRHIPPTGAPRRHPPDELLLDFATGGADGAARLLAAVHLAVCPICRATVARLERIGGALLEEIEPAALDPGLRAAVLAQLDEPPIPSGAETVAAPADADLPAPLRPYLGGGLATLSWRTVIPGLEDAFLPLDAPEGRTVRLVRIRAGVAIPPHSHGGNVLTQVLRGSFTDHRGRFAAGDFAFNDADMVHAPAADRDEDCLCLALSEASPAFVRRFEPGSPERPA